MGGTTSILSIPYPTGTDRVADGDNAMQALAEKIDGMSTNWTPLALSNGWVNFGFSYGIARIRKLHGIVHIQGVIQGGAVAPGTMVAYVPPGFRPYLTYQFPVVSNSLWCCIEVKNDGTLGLAAGAYSTALNIQCSYPADV